MNRPPILDYARRDPWHRGLLRRIARVTLGICIVGVLSSVGTWLLLDFQEYERNVNFAGSRLAPYQSQLDVIKERLENFHATHGRWPTNDEGLTCLDGFAARYEVCNDPPGSSYEWRRSAGHPARGMAFLEDEIGLTHAALGRLPATAKEIEASLLFVGLAPATASTAAADRFELVLTGSGKLLELSPAGVLTPSGLPYIYENQQGRPAGDFEDSPITSDGGKGYSVMPEPGVYVYSVETRDLNSRLQGAIRESVCARLAGLVLLLAAVAAAWFLHNRKKLSLWAAVLALLGSAGLAIGAGKLNYSTCYIISGMSPSQPRQAAEQRLLLQKYRDNGVINLSTYNKAMEAIKAAEK